MLGLFFFSEEGRGFLGFPDNVRGGGQELFGFEDVGFGFVDLVWR